MKCCILRLCKCLVLRLMRALQEKTACTSDLQSSDLMPFCLSKKTSSETTGINSPSQPIGSWGSLVNEKHPQMLGEFSTTMSFPKRLHDNSRIETGCPDRKFILFFTYSSFQIWNLSKCLRVSRLVVVHSPVTLAQVFKVNDFSSL